MKALSIFDDDMSLKQAVGYMCTTKSEQCAEGEKDPIISRRDMGY